MDIDGYIKQADSIVSNHCREYTKRFERFGVLLSGGIDSSLITTYALQCMKQLTVFSMGTDQTQDRPYIEILTAHLRIPYEWVPLSEKEISDALADVKKLLIREGIEPSLMQMSLGVGYYLIFRRANEQGVQAIITGQGPDILFAGYHKYKGMSGISLEQEIRRDIVLLETDKKRDSAMAGHFNITLLNPYLEKDFVDFALTVPAEMKLKEGVEKYFIRQWGKMRELPQKIIERPKKAFQYSTGLQKSVKNLLDR